jgi:hypothetical protein
MLLLEPHEQRKTAVEIDNRQDRAAPEAAPRSVPQSTSMIAVIGAVNRRGRRIRTGGNLHIGPEENTQIAIDGNLND